MCASSGQSRFWNVAEPLIRRRDPVRREMDRKAGRGRLPFLLCLPSFLPPCRPPSLPVNPARGSDGVGRFQGYCRRCMRRRRQAAPSARTEGRSCSRQARAQARAAGPSPSLRPIARSLAVCVLAMLTQVVAASSIVVPSSFHFLPAVETLFGVRTAKEPREGGD